MKKWPKDETKCIDFEGVFDPVTKIVRAGYQLTRKPKAKLKYTGYNIGERERVGVPPPDETFTDRWLKYHHEQGRDLLDVAMSVCFQLGIEQGRRFSAADNKAKERLAWIDGYEAGLKGPILDIKKAKKLMNKPRQPGRPDYWMAGEQVAHYRSGVKIMRISSCTARCGLPDCPDNDGCRKYFVYQMRFYGDGTREWRMANTAGVPRDQAYKEAGARAASAESFAKMRPEDEAAIQKWNADGCP